MWKPRRQGKGQLLTHATDAVAGSSYGHQKKAAVRGLPPKDLSDHIVGHGKSAPTRVRRKECPPLAPPATTAIKIIIMGGCAGNGTT